MMGSLQPSYFQLLNIFIAALLECKAQTEKPCDHLQQLNLSYVQGDSMSISCLTTTRLLESLIVKLRKDKDILIYPDNSSASQQQKWSVRKDAGNVTLHLKDIELTDEGLYECQVYSGLDCINATQFNLNVNKCKTLDSLSATPGSSVLLPCSEHPQTTTTNKVTWNVLTDYHITRIDKYRHPQKPANSGESVSDPFNMRAKPQLNGSLLIRNAVKADGLWYQCVVNEKTCYKVKLQIKDHTTTKSIKKLSTLSTALSATVPTHSPVYQTGGHTDKSATNLTVVVMATIVSVCVFVSLIICVVLYLKKQKQKISSQSQLNNRFSVYYSYVAEADFDVPIYSLIGRQTSTTMATCPIEQLETTLESECD